MELPTVDLSKPPHPDLIDLLVPFIPGLFFEISIFAADRPLFNSVLGFGLGPYSRAALFVFAAYFCGLTALVINSLILRGFLWTYRWLHARVSLTIREFEIRVMHEPPVNSAAQQSIRSKIASALQVSRLKRESGAQAVGRVWGASATRVLSHRFGIDAVEEQFSADDWSAWRAILGTPTDQEARGNSLVRALCASGWAGLLARHIAEPLQLFHYRSFCVVLIISGAINSLHVLRFWTNPIDGTLALTRNILRDIAKSPTNEQSQEEKAD